MLLIDHQQLLVPHQTHTEPFLIDILLHRLPEPRLLEAVPGFYYLLRHVKGHKEADARVDDLVPRFILDEVLDEIEVELLLWEVLRWVEEEVRRGGWRGQDQSFVGGIFRALLPECGFWGGFVVVCLMGRISLYK